ncbi:MAG TPA: hypothetical protein VGM88_19535 [Kofleriaceae bacterium]
MRWSLPLIVCFGTALAACNDLRDFRGDWQGPRVGQDPQLRVGIASATTATLDIEDIDQHGISGHLTIPGIATDAPIASIPGAEADALAGMTFAGSPIRVYLSFAPLTDGGGDAIAVIALYDDRRVEVRLLRGGTSPIYAIFALIDSP